MERIRPADYHVMPGISSGAIRCFVLDGPLQYWARYVARIVDRQESDAMRLGTAFHEAICDPDRWMDSVVVVPDTIQDDAILATIRVSADPKSKAQMPVPGEPVNMRLPLHRAYVESWRQTAVDTGRDWLTQGELAILRQQIDAVWSNPAIAELLPASPENIERVFLREDEDTGLPIKAMLDADFPGLDLFIDWKTHSHCGPHDFWRLGVVSRGYDWQAAWYSIVTGRECAAIVSIGSVPPIEAMKYVLGPDVLEPLRKTLRDHLRQIAQLHRQIDGSDVDRNGIPVIFHSDGWGGDVDPVEAFPWWTARRGIRPELSLIDRIEVSDGNT